MSRTFFLFRSFSTLNGNPVLVDAFTEQHPDLDSAVDSAFPSASIRMSGIESVCVSEISRMSGPTKMREVEVTKEIHEAAKTARCLG